MQIVYSDIVYYSEVFLLCIQKIYELFVSYSGKNLSRKCAKFSEIFKETTMKNSEEKYFDTVQQHSIVTYTVGFTENHTDWT